jgi:hypothetical protein
MGRDAIRDKMFVPNFPVSKSMKESISRIERKFVVSVCVCVLTIVGTFRSLMINYLTMVENF